jgi:hypothetical protein
MLKQPSPARLLTTRIRSAIALVLTAFMLTQATRGLRGHHAQPAWLFSLLIHGWLLIAVNVFFYAYMCWLAFWFIRGTEGRERLFMVGWFTDLLLWPLKILRPEWAWVIRHVGVLSLSASVLAALALLLEPAEPASISSGPADTN